MTQFQSELLCPCYRDNQLACDIHGPLAGDPSRNSIGKHQRPGDAAETQIESAVLVLPASGTQRRWVLDWIRVQGEHGATDEEIQLGLGMNPSTQRPRRVELVEGGWIEDSGKLRKTRSGRNAVVWSLKDEG